MYLYVCMNACVTYFLKIKKKLIWLIIYNFIIKFLFNFKYIYVFAWSYMLVLLIWKGYYQKNINEKITYIGEAKKYPPPINNYPLC